MAWRHGLHGLHPPRWRCRRPEWPRGRCALEVGKAWSHQRSAARAGAHLPSAPGCAAAPASRRWVAPAWARAAGRQPSGPQPCGGVEGGVDRDRAAPEGRPSPRNSSAARARAEEGASWRSGPRRGVEGAISGTHLGSSGSGAAWGGDPACRCGEPAEFVGGTAAVGGGRLRHSLLASMAPCCGGAAACGGPQEPLPLFFITSQCHRLPGVHPTARGGSALPPQRPAGTRIRRHVQAAGLALPARPRRRVRHQR